MSEGYSASSSERRESECACTQCRKARGEALTFNSRDMKRSDARRRPIHALEAAKSKNIQRVAELGLLPNVHRVASLEELRERLTRKGWKLLGYGAFSVAFGRGDLVWKISRPLRGHKDGGREYAADLAAGLVERTKHAPRVKMMLVDDAGDFAVLIERMDCDMEAAYGSDDAPTKQSAHALYDELNDAMGWSYGSASKSSSSSFADYIRALRDRYTGRYSFDLHGGNIMRRARDGVWVVTDPISFAQ